MFVSSTDFSNYIDEHTLNGLNKVRYAEAAMRHGLWITNLSGRLDNEDTEFKRAINLSILSKTIRSYLSAMADKVRHTVKRDILK